MVKRWPDGLETVQQARRIGRGGEPLRGHDFRIGAGADQGIEFDLRTLFSALR